MPSMLPKLPPRIATTKKVISAIRHACFLALALSIPINMNPIIFMHATYAAIQPNVLNVFVLYSYIGYFLLHFNIHQKQSVCNVTQ